MGYSIVLFWNGNRVLEGKATAVVAYDITRGHVENQFAGQTMRDYVQSAFGNRRAPFSLNSLLSMEEGDIEKGSYEDSTGRVDFTIEKLSQ